MEQKNRLILVVAITVVIIAAMFTSFGRSLLTTNLPTVTLPTPEQTQNNSTGTEASTSLLRVEVTPDTVQGVIASLSRSTSYYREVIVETLWDSNSTSTQIRR